MNFLGHIFLTPDDDEILLGNFIADSVKGNPEKYYQGKIVDGIRFHRAIDFFTDNHPLVKQGVDRLRATQGRLASVVIDVVYDHVLASDWSDLHDENLHTFTQTIYQRLEAKTDDFPDSVGRYFPYMKSQNWLFNYQFEEGLLKSLMGLDKRTSLDSEMHKTVEVFKEHESEFRLEFHDFIVDAQKMAKDYFGT